MKRRNAAGRGKTGTAPKPPKQLRGATPSKANRALNAQTRKVLGRHYAAKYRVR